MHGSYAEVPSQMSEEDIYTVQIERGVPVSCNCPDYYWRSKKDPKHVCKHEEAVDVKLKATLPLLNTPEMRSIIRSAERIFKVRRSAPNTQLIASLQIPEDVCVRKVRRQKALTCLLIAVELSPVCPEMKMAA